MLLPEIGVFIPGNPSHRDEVVDPHVLEDFGIALIQFRNLSSKGLVLIVQGFESLVRLIGAGTENRVVCGLSGLVPVELLARCSQGRLGLLGRAFKGCKALADVSGAFRIVFLRFGNKIFLQGTQ